MERVREPGVEQREKLVSGCKSGTSNNGEQPCSGLICSARLAGPVILVHPMEFDAGTFTTYDLARCLCCVLPVLQGAFGACLGVDLAERSTTCRSFGNAHVALPYSRGRRPSLMRRNRSILHIVYLYKFVIENTVGDTRTKD